MCLAGYSGSFCAPCPAGTYKYGYSYGRCLPCANKPVNAFYTTKAVATSFCPYECNSGLELKDQNPNCLNNFELQVQRILGNAYYGVAALGVFMFFVGVQWYCLVQRRSKVARETDPAREMRVDLEGDDDSDKNSSLELTTATFLRYHTYRLYFMGFNSTKLPWGVPTDDIPISALSSEHHEKLERVLSDNKERLQWSFPQTIVHNVLAIVLPPLGHSYRAMVMKSKLRILKNALVKAFDQVINLIHKFLLGLLGQPHEQLELPSDSGTAG